MNSRANRREVKQRQQPGVKRQWSSFTNLLTAELDNNPMISVLCWINLQALGHSEGKFHLLSRIPWRSSAVNRHECARYASGQTQGMNDWWSSLTSPNIYLTINCAQVRASLSTTSDSLLTVFCTQLLHKGNVII